MLCFLLTIVGCGFKEEDKKSLAEKDKSLAEKDKSLAEKDREIAELKRLWS